MDVIARVNPREQTMDDAGTRTARTRGALRRYQVMAIVTGVFLLLLTLGMIVKYALGVTNTAVVQVTGVIAMTHGFIYMAYLVTCADLWTRARWGWGRLGVLILGGVVPGLSFVVERRITREFAAAVAP
jgi:integral membrane protein